MPGVGSLPSAGWKSGKWESSAITTEEPPTTMEKRIKMDKNHMFSKSHWDRSYDQNTTIVNWRNVGCTWKLWPGCSDVFKQISNTTSTIKLPKYQREKTVSVNFNNIWRLRASAWISLLAVAALNDSKLFTTQPHPLPLVPPCKSLKNVPVASRHLKGGVRYAIVASALE